MVWSKMPRLSWLILVPLKLNSKFPVTLLIFLMPLTLKVSLSILSFIKTKLTFFLGAKVNVYGWGSAAESLVYNDLNFRTGLLGEGGL